MEAWHLETTSSQDTMALGRLLGGVLEPGSVVLLTGDLGAGKTCFAQGVARGLMVPEEVPVTSPTFVIMNQYRGRLPFSHFDLYRLSGPDDLDDIGLDDVLGREGVCLVEWPEQCGLEMPALRVRFSVVAPEKRALDVDATDPFHRRLLLKWKEALEDVQP